MVSTKLLAAAAASAAATASQRNQGRSTRLPTSRASGIVAAVARQNPADYIEGYSRSVRAAVRAAAAELDYRPFIIAKIERATALENLDTILAASDLEGKTLGGELERIGYAGDLPPQTLIPAAYLELHVEQGPVLEADQLEQVAQRLQQLVREIAKGA